MTKPDMLTKKPPKSKIIDKADPIEPGTTTEESITTKEQTDVKTANKTLDIARMEEIWGPISMATPKINCTTDPLLVIPESSKPAEDDSAEPTDAPSLRILTMLRSRRRDKIDNVRACTRVNAKGDPRAWNPKEDQLATGPLSRGLWG